jgi:transcriptional regulator with XRE-family HTH domain
MKQGKKFPNENFSDRFTALVRESPLSQKQLALALGLAESAVVNYKKGRTPKADELLRIARHFRVTMEWLLTGEGARSIAEKVKDWEDGLKKTNPKLFNEDGTFLKGKDLLNSVMLHDAEISIAKISQRADEAEAKIEKIRQDLTRIIKDL